MPVFFVTEPRRYSQTLWFGKIPYITILVEIQALSLIFIEIHIFYDIIYLWCCMAIENFEGFTMPERDKWICQFLL